MKGRLYIRTFDTPFINNLYLVKYDIAYKIVLIIIYIYFAYLGSLFPDIDMRGSYISKNLC